MPEHNPGQMGGTMRLGKRRTIFKTNNSVLREKMLQIHFEPGIDAGHLSTLFSPLFCAAGRLYGDAEYVDERHRHRFEVCSPPAC